MLNVMVLGCSQEEGSSRGLFLDCFTAGSIQAAPGNGDIGELWQRAAELHLITCYEGVLGGSNKL